MIVKGVITGVGVCVKYKRSFHEVSYVVFLLLRETFPDGSHVLQEELIAL